MERNDHRGFLASIPPRTTPLALNDPGALTRWDAWVRATVAVTELTRHLAYDTVGTDGYTVIYRDATVVGPTPPATLATLHRPSQAFFAKQLGMVQSWAEIRDERSAEVLAQIDNQFAFIAAVTGLNVTRKKWTMEWLMAVIQLTIEVELMFKHAFACYRPVDFSPQVQPIISTPGHGTYPMGHAAQAFATIVALIGLLQIGDPHPMRTQLIRQARRISINRVVAGVHFPIDAAAGQMLGLSVGEYFLCMSKVAGARCVERHFTPSGNGDDPANDYLGDGPALPQGGFEGAAPIGIVHSSPYLEKLKTLALDEWAI